MRNSIRRTGRQCSMLSKGEPILSADREDGLGIDWACPSRAAPVDCRRAAIATDGLRVDYRTLFGKLSPIIRLGTRSAQPGRIAGALGPGRTRRGPACRQCAHRIGACLRLVGYAAHAVKTVSASGLAPPHAQLPVPLRNSLSTVLAMILRSSQIEKF